MGFRVKLAGIVLVACASAFGAQPALAQDTWQLTKLDAGQYPKEIVIEERARTKGELPDGLVATSEGGDIVAAWYGDPTKRYRHAILGDGIEAGSLYARTREGINLKVKLPNAEVFEDRAPRLADLDGDGTIEIITIRSSVTKGASLTIYGINGLRLSEKATTGFIGQSKRWLNVAGIAPFLGTKFNEIAYVVTPHIGGTLYFSRYENGKLTNISAATNFSNHVISSREMRLSAVMDINGDNWPDIAAPSADRAMLRIMGFNRQKKLGERANVALPSPIDKAIAIENGDKKGFVVGLENGEVYLVHP